MSQPNTTRYLISKCQILSTRTIDLLKIFTTPAKPLIFLTNLDCHSYCINAHTFTITTIDNKNLASKMKQFAIIRKMKKARNM